MNIHAQSQGAGSITYIHNRPASFKSQFLQFLMTLAKIKTRTEKRINTKQFSAEAAEIPGSMQNNFALNVDEINGRKIWTFTPKNNISEKVIVYLHGGAYISNMTKYDWQLVNDLLIKTNANLVVPDYPLAPAANYRNVYDFFDKLYHRLLSGTSPKNIVFMGNSSGGGFALAFAQKLRNEKQPQPSQIILVSPWLDITMSHPEIEKMDKKDKALGIKGLVMAGELYADTIDKKDFKVSPVYGDFRGLPKISVFIGTHDLFIADIRKMKSILDEANIPVNYFEYPKMFHVWVAVTGLKESRHAIGQITSLINEDN